jgi:hypothetical protein
MSSAVTPEQEFPAGVDLISNMTEVLAGQVHAWSRECQRFLDWQKHTFLSEEPAEVLRSRHEGALKRLIAAGRMLSAATSDSEFMDRRAADLVRARMTQLRHSWEISHPAMSPDEAEAFLTKHFKPAPQ